MGLTEPILPTIQEDICTGCGDCVATCPSGALDIVGGKAALARPDDCAYCGDCETLCPQGAIALPFEIAFEEELDAPADCANR